MPPPGTEFPEYEENKAYQYSLDSDGQDIENKAVQKVTADKLHKELTALIGDAPNRAFNNPETSVKVENYLEDKLKIFGYTTCLHSFHAKDQDGLVKAPVELKNVIAFIQGTGPDTVTVGAHYDSRPFHGLAPGAEDNGSGVAATLAIAEAFAKAKGLPGMPGEHKPTASVYVTFFAGEEAGMLGSDHFAEALLAQNDPDQSTILYQKDDAGIPSACSLHQAKTQGQHTAILMDEIGWRSPNEKLPTVNLESYDWTKALMDELYASSKRHNKGALRITHSGKPFGSDHMSFLSRNMPAVLTINGDDTAYPNYHSSKDTIENVDFDFLTMITKMNLGALVNLAFKAPSQ